MSFKKPVPIIVCLSFGLLVSLAGAAYCFLGVLMAGSFGASPGYPKERFEYNVSFWTTGTLLLAAISVLFGFLLTRQLFIKKSTAVSR